MITQFHADTPQEVKNILRDYCHTGKRLRLFFGDTQTGRDWAEEKEVIGTVGNSTGNDDCKIPILLANRRSMGGGAILDHCIVRIIDTKSKRELWRHAHYRQAEYRVVPANEKGEYSVFANTELIANFDNKQSALNWIQFMRGERMSK